jgi:anti-anti-sigma factor
MGLQVDTGDENGVVRLIGELDISTVPQASPAVAEACERSSRVVVDLSELTFMDSSGVRMLLQAWANQHERGRDLVLRAPTTTVRRLFDLLGLEANGVTIEPGVEER